MKKRNQKFKKDWPLGFLGFMAITGIRYFETKNPADLFWVFWIVWFLYFIPRKNEKVRKAHNN